MVSVRNDDWKLKAVDAMQASIAINNMSLLYTPPPSALVPIPKMYDVPVIFHILM